MGIELTLKDGFILLSVMTLLTLGVGLALNSGSVAVAGHHQAQGRPVWNNLIQTVVALGVCLFVLVICQHLVGFRLNLLS